MYYSGSEITNSIHAIWSGTLYETTWRNR